jgi:MoxR-like ATPase
MHKIIPVLPKEKEELMKFYIQQRIPFILEGPPGTGKSLAARYWSKEITGSDPIKIDITEDTELTHVLGDIDWKRLLAESHQVKESGQILPSPLCKKEGWGDFTALYERYYVPSAAIKAMQEGRVLIVEELDRCGRDTLFPVFFDMIEYKQAYVPALQREIIAEEGFNVIITVNRDTDVGTVRLPDAFLRRLRRIFIPNPDFQTEVQIVLANIPDASESLVEQIVRTVQNLRKLELQHRPAPSETVQWVSDLINMFGQSLDKATNEQLSLTLSAICKDIEDEEFMLKAVGTTTTGKTRSQEIPPNPPLAKGGRGDSPFNNKGGGRKVKRNAR